MNYSGLSYGQIRHSIGGPLVHVPVNFDLLVYCDKYELKRVCIT